MQLARHKLKFVWLKAKRKYLFLWKVNFNVENVAKLFLIRQMPVDMSRIVKLLRQQ